MVKKTLLSLAVATAIAGLTGCNVSSTDKYDDSVNLAPVTSGAPHVDSSGNIVKSTQVIYDPAAKNAAGLPNIPLITDLLLKGLGDPDKIDVIDGTIPFVAKKMGEEGYNPIFSAVTDLDGFSTSSAIDIPFSGPLNATTIKTMADGVTAANVILVPLNYTNDPVTGTNNDGNGVIDATNMFGTPVSITASVVSYTDVETAQNKPLVPVVLRIMPNEPLKPATRYLVIVTDSVKDLYGYSVKASNTFSLMASTKTPFADPTKKTLQETIQTWTKLAVGFTGGLGQKNTVGNIAYATTFTTGGTTTVLASMAAPSLVNEAVKQPLPAAARYQIEKALVDNDGKIPEATTQVATWIQALAGSSVPTTKATGDALIAALGGANAMATNLGGLVTLAKTLPQPAPRVAKFDADVTSADTGGLKMRNGSIKLPYYLNAPQMDPAVPASLATAAYTITSIWKADNTLATDLGALLEAKGIPAVKVTPPSDKVTRHFPLAKTGAHTGADGMGLVDVPISVFYHPSACTSGEYTPVIYLHGFTSKRTAAIPFTLAAVSAGDACIATVAIDLPLHGLEPTDAALLGALYPHPQAPSAENNVAYGMSKQRHFGLTSTAEGKPTKFGAADAKAGAGSGSLFINILNFQGTRDNLRQAVMDQLNLNASIRFLDTNAAQGRDTGLGIKFKADAPVKFVGHSLGAIVGTDVVALTNALGGEGGASNYLNKVEASVLANGGGVLTKLLENSPAYSSTIMGGFAALGQQAGLPLSQGTSLMELTLHILQATVDSADPINFSGMLASSAENSGVLALEIVGDGTSNSADQVVPPAAFEANGLKPMVLNDTDETNNKYADTAASPLAGTTPLVNFAGLAPVDASVTTGTDYLRKTIKYTAGDHSSFGRAVKDGPTSTAAKIATDAVSFLKAGGKGLTINDANIVKSAQ